MQTIKVKEAIGRDYVFIDVRTPKEHEECTIPGSLNIPLFSNEERAIVGTLYNKKGQGKAIEKGLEFFSKSLLSIMKEITKYKEKEIVVFCWRGGMRSKCLVALLDSLGFRIKQLEGGHKAYRKFVREKLEKYKLKPRLVVLYGLTGAGKTEIINQLKNSLDLEGIAQHRSSLFGGVGLKPRSQKMFEALLLKRLEELQKEKFVIVEGESMKVGNVQIPEFLYREMKKGLNVKIKSRMDERVKRIVKEYFKEHHEEIKEIIPKLKKKMGNKKVEKLLELMKEKGYEEVAEVLLREYYDPLYKHTVEGIEYCLVVEGDYVKEIEEFLDDLN